MLKIIYAKFTLLLFLQTLILLIPKKNSSKVRKTADIWKRGRRKEGCQGISRNLMTSTQISLNRSFIQNLRVWSDHPECLTPYHTKVLSGLPIKPTSIDRVNPDDHNHANFDKFIQVIAKLLFEPDPSVSDSNQNQTTGNVL